MEVREEVETVLVLRTAGVEEEEVAAAGAAEEVGVALEQEVGSPQGLRSEPGDLAADWGIAPSEPVSTRWRTSSAMWGPVQQAEEEAGVEEMLHRCCAEQEVVG